MADPTPPADSPLERIRRIVDENTSTVDTSNRKPVEAIPVERPTTTTAAADAADAAPKLGGGLDRFAGLLTLSPALHLFNRAAILNYGHLKRGNSFQLQKRESLLLFRICFGIDLTLRVIAALLILAVVAVTAWKALFR